MPTATRVSFLLDLWKVHNVDEELVLPELQVEAVAYDNPIPGYGTRNAINLRLWAAKPSNQFDLVIPFLRINICSKFGI